MEKDTVRTGVSDPPTIPDVPMRPMTYLRPGGSEEEAVKSLSSLADLSGQTQYLTLLNGDVLAISPKTLSEETLDRDALTKMFEEVRSVTCCHEWRSPRKMVNTKGEHFESMAVRHVCAKFIHQDGKHECACGETSKEKE